MSLRAEGVAIPEGKFQTLNTKQYQITKSPMLKRVLNFEFRYWDLFKPALSEVEGI
jgi:hypothetical protein